MRISGRSTETWKLKTCHRFECWSTSLRRCYYILFMIWSIVNKNNFYNFCEIFDFDRNCGHKQDRWDLVFSLCRFLHKLFNYVENVAISQKTKRFEYRSGRLSSSICWLQLRSTIVFEIISTTEVKSQVVR